MSHDVGVWIDHMKAIIVSIAAGVLLVSLMFVEVDPNLKESITLALKEDGTTRPMAALLPRTGWHGCGTVRLVRSSRNL